MIQPLGGNGYQSSSSNSINQMQALMNRIIQVMQELIDARDEISQQLLDELERDTKAMKELEKQLAKKKSPQLQKKIEAMTIKLAQMDRALATSGQYNTPEGKAVQAKMISMRSTLEDMRRKQAIAETAASDAPIIPEDNGEGTVV
ncbi:hypothetical protein ACFL4J_00530 [Candidatus Margulisiibacteriota bacterium]